MRDQTADVDKNASSDAGIENLPLKELFPWEYGEEIFMDRLQALLRDKSLWMSLDHDVKGPDMRPGRSYYVLKAVMEELTILYGSACKAADCLVLSAVRAGTAAIEKEDEKRRLEWEKKNATKGKSPN